MAREKAQAAPTARPKVPMRRRGADCPVVVRHRLCRPTANETLIPLPRRRYPGAAERLFLCSAEAGVMLVERRGQVIAVGSEPTGNRRSSNSRRKAAAFVRWHEPDDARVSRPDL